ncbi:DUF3093 domain-containing protein [Nesterenkonia sp. LB17]|uniref:DUF3093 domain-containing protein n=1 Tax=unclassified Nesterenkonia TaxID=2629769 RepID=UPI001F4C8020|nr:MULTISPECIES: DUF3093 domain-containing protein [unclassified Nesterenkonia]MCH8565332.1 DUF3093 domain-containing protein [Nesterenkonia sp. LB17]MCH8571250.1 DUF3093 domain-containing protein [Nesterenkonia sp. AY15]
MSDESAKNGEASSPSVDSETAPIYTEKLWPAWWLWVAGVMLGASISLIFFPISITFGLLTVFIGIGLVIFGLVITTPTLEVTPGWLRVGRARIQTVHLGRVVAHRGDAAREQLGPGFDASSYQCIRGWIDPVITAQIIDPKDATPYWIFSTRKPNAVLSALGSAEPVQEHGVSFE